MTMKSLGVPVEYPVDQMAGALVGDLVEGGTNYKDVAAEVRAHQKEARSDLEKFFQRKNGQAA